MSDHSRELAQARSERDHALARLEHERAIAHNNVLEIEDLLRQIERLKLLNNVKAEPEPELRQLLIEANASIRIQRAIAIEDCVKALEKYGIARIRDEKDYPASVIAACLHLIRTMGGEK